LLGGWLAPWLLALLPRPLSGLLLALLPLPLSGGCLGRPPRLAGLSGGRPLPLLLAWLLFGRLPVAAGRLLRA
ncbi:hypothetical protein, partial [Arthrobacter sp. Leaf141]|uniref:hypothetical protein n=1 Tax=Arthrobacter sp. Leaf141 TaxID=1736273 RepID=UPI001F21E622